MSPKVSVIIANHNYGKWLPNAINSAAKDTYLNKRIIVVDDGSNDGSQNIVRELMTDVVDWCSNDGKVGGVEGKFKDSEVPIRLICLSQAHGPSAARNIGIQTSLAETDIYAILDADDEYRAGKIAKSVERIMDAHEEIGAVYTDYDTINPDGLLTRNWKEPFDYGRLIQECIVHSACVINKKVFEKVGFYDPDLRTCEDYDLYLRAAEYFMIIHIPEPLMLVRVGSHDSTHTVNKDIWNRNWQRVMQKLQSRYAKN